MIDLNKTLEKARMTKTDLANVFDVNRQNVSYWCNVQVPIKWYFKVQKFFADKGLKIYYL